VFERLDNYGVTLNGKKCQILRKSLDYFGVKKASIHYRRRS
jgi:hypothetical protein